MKDLIEFLRDFWGLVVMIGGGIGSYFTWRATRKKSNQMLYDELEKMKQKIIIQVGKDIENAKEKAEKDLIILGLKNHCPECYNSYMKKQEDERAANS